MPGSPMSGAGGGEDDSRRTEPDPVDAQRRGHAAPDHVTPERQSASTGRGAWIARVASGGALLVGLVLVLVVLFGGSSGHTYHLLFQNGGQLVGGNQVLVAGQPIGNIDDISLTKDAQADVTISVDEQLHEGTTAIIRATSLSGIANRYVSITPGPDNAPELGDGATLNGRADHLPGRPRPALRHLPAQGQGRRFAT